MLTKFERIAGCLFGGAIGDALGAPVEFLSLESIRSRYGSKGIQELPAYALYTDDTQLTLRVAQGLLDAQRGEWREDPYLEGVAKQIVKWLDEDPPRAPGQACLHGAINMKNEVHPLSSGKPDSKGCGSVMRSAPYGLLPDTFVQPDLMAARHSRMTHHGVNRQDVAAAASAALAGGVHVLLYGERVHTTISHMIQAAQHYDIHTATLIEWAAILAGHPATNETYLFREWLGWKADEAIAAATYCFVKHANDYEATIRLAANTPGDSDSIASIAGNLSGTYLGIKAIPERWVINIENAPHIDSIAKQIAALHPAD